MKRSKHGHECRAASKTDVGVDPGDLGKACVPEVNLVCAKFKPIAGDSNQDVTPAAARRIRIAWVRVQGRALALYLVAVHKDTRHSGGTKQTLQTTGISKSSTSHRNNSATLERSARGMGTHYIYLSLYDDVLFERDCANF